MKYNYLGNTDIKVSKLGFGVARLPEKKVGKDYYLEKNIVRKMVETAVERGINYFDSGNIYCHGQSQRVVAEALKPYRDKVYLANKVMPKDLNKKGDLIKKITILLDETHQKYFDFFYFWGINRKDFDGIILKNDFLQEALDAKRKGLINHIGFSFHDAPSAMQYIIDIADIFETVICQYNLLDRTNEKMIEYASKKGLGVIIMSPLAGGTLLAPEKYKGESVTVEDAMKFVMDNPNVACTLTGINSQNELLQNIQIAEIEEPISKKRIQYLINIMDNMKKKSKINCTGCNYCQPCPQKINISNYFNLYMLADVYKLNKIALDSYNYCVDIEKEEDISKCVGCRQCVDRCTQHIDIPIQLEKVKKFFETLNRFYIYGKATEERQ